jgi:protein-disulfide isomerase
MLRSLAVTAASAAALALAGCGGGDDKAASTTTATTPTTATTETTATAETTPGGEQLQPPAANIDGIPQSGVTLGSEDAPVTLYEFADLQCPFCAEYTKSAFPQVVEQYVRPGKVKVVFRNLTFIGPDSVTAARAAAAAGQQNKLWNFIDTFYANQGEENSGYVTDAFITQIAGAAALDANALTQAMQSPDVDKQIGEAQQMAQQFKVNSTPSFLVQVGNGKPKPLGNKSADFGAISAKLDAALK